MSESSTHQVTAPPQTGQTMRPWAYLQQIPFVFWMVGATLALALMSNLSAAETIDSFNAGFGRALGEFTLILLPAFTLAAVIAKLDQNPSTRTIATMMGLAPVSGAGMVCPDTAYAALAPAAQTNTKHKLSIAFGAYAGFKLLFPAGPLLVATALGAQNDPKIIWVGALLLLPVWLGGLFWARMMAPRTLEATSNTKEATPFPKDQKSKFNWRANLGPFVILVSLIAIGFFVEFSSLPLLDLLTQPKGALIAAALFALAQLPANEWRPCLEQASRRTAGLILLIGSASAFGAVLTEQLDLSNIATIAQSQWLLFYLFGLTMLFKLIQGSSLATFAAITPVAAPIIAGADISPVIATFAICLGSFIAIMPNDSFYWLVRRDALTHLTTERQAVLLLSGGAIVQALIGLLLLWILSAWI
ncbi:hypothetical protein [Maritalea myrionectae]|uniref:GntT/GntP/DsdX family permease n=1 Tax=Maritalea myrionectae TaxID=454601 RepID=UPI00040B3E0D|nr:hypothetical protein [Maritalea myrionectae]